MLVALAWGAMCSQTKTSRALLLAAISILAVLPAVPSHSEVIKRVFHTTLAGTIKAEYLYYLSNFKGPLKLGWVRVFPENRENEIYVMTGPSVNIFNDSGMEIYNFGFDTDLGSFYDATVDGDGNVLTLSYVGFQPRITKQNFRGDPIAPVELKNIPAELAGLMPTRILLKDGRLYLADLAQMRVLVTDENGMYRDSYDLAALLGFTEDERRDSGLNNINVANDGSLLFTVPVVANAYIITPDRQVTKFGKRGSGPGRFGIPSDVISDDQGNYFVVDTLKCAVMVFDKDRNFLTEFGYRGPNPSNLIAPRSLSMDNKGRLYVTQSVRRGVSVFQIRYK